MKKPYKIELEKQRKGWRRRLVIGSAGFSIGFRTRTKAEAAKRAKNLSRALDAMLDESRNRNAPAHPRRTETLNNEQTETA